MTATQLLTLIVEDDPSTREFLAKALAKHGIHPVEAGSVGEALVRLDREPMPGAIVLDLVLPDANGSIVLHRVRRKGLPIRVAVVTGVADPSPHLQGGNFAPDRVFKKPLDLAALIAWLREGGA
jgi:DNA-binding response OmpR family regulator